MAVVIYRECFAAALGELLGPYFRHAFDQTWLPLVSNTGPEDHELFDDVIAKLGREGIVHRTSGRELSPAQTRARAIEEWRKLRMSGTTHTDPEIEAELLTDLLDLYVIRQRGYREIGGSLSMWVDTGVGLVSFTYGHLLLGLIQDLRVSPWQWWWDEEVYRRQKEEERAKSPK